MTSAEASREDRRIRSLLAATVAVLTAAAAAGPAAAATLRSVALQRASEVQEVTFDGSGNAWVTGKGPLSDSQRPSVFKVLPDGRVERYAVGDVGTRQPQGIVFANGFLYVCVPTDEGAGRAGYIAEVRPAPPSPGDAVVRTLRVDADALENRGGCWDLATGPPGTNRIYYSGGRSETVGYVNPATWTKTEFALPAEPGGGSRQPAGITAGPDGRIYFTLYDADVIARIDANLAAPSYVRAELDPDRDETVHPRDITPGPDGALWVTEEGRSALDRVTTSMADERRPLAPEVRPNRIVAAPDGTLWFSGFDGRLGRHTPASAATAHYGLPAGATPRGLAVGPNDTIWIAGEGSGVLYGLPLELAPITSGVTGEGTVGGRVTIGVDVDARGVQSSLLVDFGPTSGYGTTSPPLDAGALDGVTRHQVAFEGISPGTYHFRVRASNAFGQRVGEDRTVVVPSPPPGPPPDRDGDGLPDGTDCAPEDPTRSQLLPEILGNDKDEDCDGEAEPYPKMASIVAYRFKAFGPRVKFTRLAVTDVPAGATVQMRCKAPKKQRRACPFKRYAKAQPRARQRVQLIGRLADRRLPPGITIEVRVVHDQQIGVIRRLRVVPGGVDDRYRRCLVPGRKKPSRCPPAGRRSHDRSAGRL